MPRRKGLLANFLERRRRIRMQRQKITVLKMPSELPEIPITLKPKKRVAGEVEVEL